MRERGIALDDLLLHDCVKVPVYHPGITKKSQRTSLLINDQPDAAWERLSMWTGFTLRDMECKTRIGLLLLPSKIVVIGPDLSSILLGDEVNGLTQQPDTGMLGKRLGSVQESGQISKCY